MMKAMFGAGCFWGIEEAFRRIPGVIETAVGYSGGSLTKPTYQDVCSSSTGHTEVVEVTFDESKVSFGQLLDLFWTIHDPTTLNRQGPDVGTQYRSAIYYVDDVQKAEAEASKALMQASGKFRRPIVTEITPASTFWRGEDYHQQYLAKRGQSDCHI